MSTTALLTANCWLPKIDLTTSKHFSSETIRWTSTQYKDGLTNMLKNQGRYISPGKCFCLSCVKTGDWRTVRRVTWRVWGNYHFFFKKREKTTIPRELWVPNQGYRKGAKTWLAHRIKIATKRVKSSEFSVRTSPLCFSKLPNLTKCSRNGKICWIQWKSFYKYLSILYTDLLLFTFNILYDIREMFATYN